MKTTEYGRISWLNQVIRQKNRLFQHKKGYFGINMTDLLQKDLNKQGMTK